MQHRLAQAATDRGPERRAQIVALSERRSRVASYPLSHAQRGMWWIQQFSPESAAYNQAVAFMLRGPVDQEALEAALLRLVRRHEILRTVYEAALGGEPRQRVLPAADAPLQLERFSVGRADVRPLLEQAIARPFDLSARAPVRAVLVHAEPDITVLALFVHHIGIDGWSAVRVIGPELAAEYDRCRRGQTGLPPLEIQYKDYAIADQARTAEGAFNAHLGYWKATLAGAPDGVALPTDHSRPAQQTFIGERVLFDLAPEAFARFERLCAAERLPLVAGMIGALDILLASWSGQTDIVLGTVTANRAQPEVQGLIGNFIQFLPLRTRVREAASARDVLTLAGDTFLEARLHEDCPFPLIAEHARPRPRSPDQNPIYNVAFLLHRFPAGEAVENSSFEAGSAEERALFEEFGMRWGRAMEFGDARGGTGWIDNPGALLDLRVLAFPFESGGCLLECEFNTALFERETAQRVLATYAALLEEIAAFPERRVSELLATRELVVARQGAAVAARPDGAAVSADVTAPLTSIQETLASIFRDVLGVPRVGIHESFFAAGGDSMRALQALSRIEEQLDVRLPVSALNEARTIAGLEALVTKLRPSATPGAEADEQPPLSARTGGLITTFNSTGRKRPLICTHPVGGAIQCYAELAAALGPEQPLIAVRAVGLDGEAEPLTSIPGMAERALAELDAIAVGGPYTLVAWSFGGSIAYELARRLSARGDRVERLVMIDSWSPFALEDSADDYFDESRSLVWLALNVYGERIGSARELYERMRVCKDRERRVDALHATAVAAGVRHVIPRNHLTRLVDVFLANANALLRYAPEPALVPCAAPALFLAPEVRGSDADHEVLALGLSGEQKERFLGHILRPAERWRELIPDLQTAPTPGDHYSSLTGPNARALAERLRGLLESTTGTPASAG